MKRLSHIATLARNSALCIALVILSGCDPAPAEVAAQVPAPVTAPITADPEQLSNLPYYSLPSGSRCCTIIAHAGGAIDGNSYTNSVEAVEANYANGLRLFELDFLQTADGHWVASHDWPRWRNMSGHSGKVPPTLDVFAKTKITKAQKSWSIGAEYTPITMDWLRGFLNTHEDAQVVTDTKELSRFPEFVKMILALPERDQFVFQAYSISHIDLIKKQNPGARVILTLYRMGRGRGKAAKISGRREMLMGITLPMNWADEPETLEPLLATGVPLFLHGSPLNINSRALHAYFAKKGISGFYLD